MSELQSSTSYVCVDSGAKLAAEDLTTVYFSLEHNKLHETVGLPPRVVMPAETATALQTGGAQGGHFPSITLLSFRPADALTYLHQVRARILLSHCQPAASSLAALALLPTLLSQGLQACTRPS